MKDIQLIIWFFPILFMFHDFEEIIFMKPWIVKNADRLTKKYPRIAKIILSRMGTVSTSSFALGVAEEFIVISIITVVTHITSWYYLWLGVFIAFFIHLIIHCVQAIAMRCYVPSIVTSALCLPICLVLGYDFFIYYQPNTEQIALFSIVGLVLTVLNLWGIHRGMLTFDKWLKRYQNAE